MSRASSFSCWSRKSARSGEITNTGFGRTIEGTW
jgi:hypothetical protein